MPPLFISAAHKSSGKTTVTLGLCRALRQAGWRVQPFKKGPDYIDPIWHGLAAGQPSYNLDFHMMARGEIESLYARHAPRGDIVVIEGNKGLYDGMDVAGSNSNAALAKLLGASVILVLDTQGMTRGVAPLLLGYRAFDPEVRIAGVILNKVGGERHEGKLREVIAHYTDIPVLGAVRQDARLAIRERHLGLMPGNESLSAEASIQGIADSVAAQVDIAAVARLAGGSLGGTLATTAAHAACDVNAAPAPEAPGLRLAYARDRAFAFYYQEDLDTLRAAGVELLPVDLLADTDLPACDGLLLGGGFPEVFAAELEANAAMRTAVRAVVESGLPTYAECGGLMYLSRSLRWGERAHAMAGVLPGDAVMGERPVGRGYAVLEQAPAMPWPSPGGPVPAHEFHYSRLENLPEDLSYAYVVQRGHGIHAGRDGLLYKGLLASYCHRRGSGAQGWITPFLAQMRAWKDHRNAAVHAA